MKNANSLAVRSAEVQPGSPGRGGLPETTGTSQPGTFGSSSCPCLAGTVTQSAFPAKSGRYEERQGSFPQPAGDRGFALVFTLLLLSMMSLMALAMVLSSSSDMLINGYYRNARGSFYAADSGLNIARQQLINQIQGQVPATFAVPPIASPATAAATVQSSVLNSWASGTSLNSGQAADSWSESFKVVNTTSCPTQFQYASYSITSYDSNSNPNGYRYIFNYQLCATGMAQGSEQTTVSESGNITLNVSGTGSQTTTSFAYYGAFIDQFPPCLGPLVPGYLTGPMFTNGEWQWGTSGTYTFTDSVGQQDANFDFWFGNNCIQSPTVSYKSGNQTIKPQFQGSPSPGYALGQNQAPLPVNEFSQEWAVLDGKGCGEGSNVCGSTSGPAPPSLTNANLNAVLKNASGTPYPSGGASTGVFMNFTTTSGVNSMAGGGFLVEGNASVTLSTSGSSAQIVAISQGSGSSKTTTTITVDPLATPPTAWNCPAGTTGTTTVGTKVGSGSTTTVNFCAVPMNRTPSAPAAATMLYVDGDITSLAGTGQGVGGISDHNALTITANGDIDITGDVIYETEPVTTSANQVVAGTNPACCNGSPADTLIPGNDNGQVFGLFTTNGNINFDSPYSNNNLQVDGSMAAIAQGKNLGFGTPNGSINTLSNVGGRIENQAHSVNMNAFNIYFDRRFTANQGFAPPWFPSTTITAAGPTQASSTASAQRVQWLLKNM
jgi:Tfp pilus assembly protein PilX